MKVSVLLIDSKYIRNNQDIQQSNSMDISCLKIKIMNDVSPQALLLQLMRDHPTPDLLRFRPAVVY